MYDFDKSEQQRREAMGLSDVRKIGRTLNSTLNDLITLTKVHPDSAIQAEAGRELADVFDYMQRTLPRLKKECAGFKVRWERELHVKGRTRAADAIAVCSRQIIQIHLRTAGLLSESVWNLVSSPKDQRPYNFIPAPGFQGFLRQLRDWSALRAQVKILEHKPREKSSGILSALLSGKPLKLGPAPKDRKRDFVACLTVELEREIAGPRLGDYWRALIQKPARAVWKDYRDSLPAAKRTRVAYPAHALRTLKTALRASLQRNF